MDGTYTPPDTRDYTGHQFGSYRLIGSLRQEKFSELYLAEHTQTKAQYLVEVLYTHLREEQARHFYQQTRVLTQLIQPSILRIREAGIQEHTPFLVYDNTAHTPLSQKHPGGMPRPLVDILPLVKSLAEALHYAHTQGVLHKDIRPGNILLQRNGGVLLTHFAIDVVTQSRQQPKHMKSEEVLESLGYMAPEQIQGHAVAASDQYALAMVVYEWLTGSLPFAGSYTEIIHQHMHVQPPVLRKKVPTIPRAVEEVIFIALMKEPQQRFVNIVAFANALEKAYNPLALPTPTEHVPAVKPFIASVAATPPIKRAVSTSPPHVELSRQAVLQHHVTPPTAFVPPQPVPATPPVALVAHTPAQPVTVSSPQHVSGHSAPQKSAVAQRKTTATPSVSRRAFVAGLVGVTILGGGGAWAMLSRRTIQSSFASGSTPVTASPTVSTHPQQTGGTRLVYRAHPARVSALAWNPAGSLIASASDDHTVQICDAKTGATTLTYHGHSAEVFAVAWSPNGKYIASAGADKTVQVWNASSGARITTYQQHTDSVNTVAWSSDSRLLASGSDNSTVHLWMALTGGQFIIYAQHTAGVLSVAWSPDNTVVASGSWDNTVKAISTIQTESFALGGTVFDYRGHAAEVYSVTWSPDGKYIASASGDKVVQVGRGIDGGTIFTYTGHADIVRAVTWASDGKRLASASADNTVQIWSASSQQKTTRESLFTYRGHSNAVYDVAWSPNGVLLSSGSSDNTMQVWQAL